MAAWMPAGTSTRPATVPIRLACSTEVEVAMTRTARVWGTAAG